MKLPASVEELKNTLYFLGYFPDDEVVQGHWKQLRAKGREAMSEICKLYPGLKSASDEIFFYTFFPYHILPSGGRFSFMDPAQAMSDRHDMGFSYEEIGEDIGLSRDAVRRIAIREVKPKKETIEKIRLWLSRSSSTLVL